MHSTPPLFIPLKRAFFEAFESGTKHEEYRLYGARWNERTCRIGRRVTLSLGYGRHRRLSGTITGFRTEADPATLPGWVACYSKPQTSDARAACIHIQLDPKP